MKQVGEDALNQLWLEHFPLFHGHSVRSSKDHGGLRGGSSRWSIS